MTTIAWDGEVLAADRQCTSNGVRVVTRKILNCGDYWYAGAGAVPDIAIVSLWLAEGAPADDLPELSEANVFGIAVRKRSARAFVIEGKFPCLRRIYGKHAEGSGREFAISALALGHGSVDAVRFACKFDVYSGMGIDSVSAKSARKRKAT